MYRVWWPQAKQGHGVRFRLLVDALRYIIRNGHHHDAWLRKEPVQGQDHEPWQPAESFVLPARLQPAAAQQSSPSEPAAAQSSEPTATHQQSGEPAAAVVRSYVVPAAPSSRTQRRRRITTPWHEETVSPIVSFSIRRVTTRSVVA